MIVAWHEVPGKNVHRENRPVGYGMIGSRCARLRESDRTLRDGSFGWRAAPGTSCQATIVPSLWDKTIRTSRVSHYVSAYGVETPG